MRTIYERARPFAWLTCVLLAGCGAQDNGDPGEKAHQAEFDDRVKVVQPLSFEQFREASRFSADGKDYFMVEWDYPIHSEAALRVYYDETFFGDTKKAIVKTMNADGSGGDDVWLNQEELELTYCVANNWGSPAAKDQAIADMAAAARAWERVVNVEFRYVPAEDVNCVAGNTSVRINVRSWGGNGACSYWPRSGISCEANSLVFNYSSNYGSMTDVGVFIHEIGHILGLHHEHMRTDGPNDPDCSTTTQYRVLTAYDSMSTMHYPWCDNASGTGATGELTVLDAYGTRSLYGAPVPWQTSVIDPQLF